MISQSWVGKTIGGRYKIEALLGQGGMSAVYRAFDPNLRRTVAIKLIHPHLSTDPNFIGRFKEEAAAVARLRHPNIVQVHDFNLDGDTYYMVMEYLVGETLQARLKRLSSTGRCLSISDAVRICIQICEAAGYAHNHELIHRDIKPANIILNVHEQAILMDFGIVKIIGGEYHTVTGATIGTAMYMSPEQIRGERVDDRSDIYSLGVTLYEMLSGRPPFQADSVVTLMMMVLNDPLPDLRELRADIPDELIPVISRVLAKDKSQRYQSMAEVAAALQQVLDNLGIVSPPVTAVDQSQNPVLEPLDHPPLETKTPGTIPPETEKGDVLPETWPESAPPDQAIQNQEVMAASGNFIGGMPPEPVPTPPGSTIIKPQAVISKRLIVPILGVILLLAAVITGYYLFASGKPPTIQLTPITFSSIPINADTAKSVVSLGKWRTDSDVVDLAFSPDATLLTSANNRDGESLSKYRFYASIWQVDTGELIAYLLGQTKWVSGVAFSPDGRHIAIASEDASISIWQAPGGSLERKIQTTFGALSGIDYSPNHLTITASSLDGYVGVWQADNGNLLRTMQKQDYGVYDGQFSPDGDLIASASDDSSIYLWKVNDGSLAMTLTGHTAAVNRVRFSLDGSLLASASADYSIGLWRLRDGKLLHLIQGHADDVKDVAFSLDGSILASASDDGTICLWNVKDGNLLTTLTEEEPILSLAFSPNGYYLTSGGSDGTIHFWGISAAIPLGDTSTPKQP